MRTTSPSYTSQGELSRGRDAVSLGTRISVRSGGNMEMILVRRRIVMMVMIMTIMMMVTMMMKKMIMVTKVLK